MHVICKCAGTYGSERFDDMTGIFALLLAVSQVDSAEIVRETVNSQRRRARRGEDRRGNSG